MAKLTIGVTTYRRPELLARAIASVLKPRAWQPGELEILIGNDDQSTPLTIEGLRARSELASLDLDCVRIINYPKNLRETGNMAELLSQAQAPFFTWLADDDEWATGFSAWARGMVLADLRRLDAAVTTYGIIDAESRIVREHGSADAQEKIWAGAKYRSEMLAGRTLVHTPSSLFRTTRLREWKGYEPLGESPVGLYGEFLLSVKMGDLERILVCDRPLYLYREHAESWGVGNQDVELYERLGLSLVEKGARILFGSSPSLGDDIYHLARHTIGNLVGKLKAAAISQARDFERGRVDAYLSRIHEMVTRLGEQRGISARQKFSVKRALWGLRCYAWYRIFKVALDSLRRSGHTPVGGGK